MNNNLLQILIRAKDEASGTLAKVGNSTEALGHQTNAFAASALQATGAVAVLTAAAAGAMAVFGLKAAAGMQQTNASLTVLTGSTATANKLFGELAKYANNTPFEFPELAKGAQTLLGFGISSSKVMPNIKMLGDIAAATGARFDDLSLVFGQVNATGHLMGQDALQLINNRIPITTILAKNLGVSVQEVRKRMEAGSISADLFNEALLGVTKEGGFAFGGTEKLAQTLNGRMSTLKDTMTQLVMKMVGVKVSAAGLVIDPNGLFTKTTDAILKLTVALNNLPAIWDKWKVAFIAGAGAMAGVLVGIIALNWALVASSIAAGVALAIALAPFILIGAGIAAAAAAIYFNWAKIVEVFEKVKGAVSGAYKAVGESAKGAASASASAWNAFASTMVSVWNTFVTQTVAVWNAIYSVAIKPFVEMIKFELMILGAVFGYLWQWVTALTVMAWKAIYETAIKPALDWIVSGLMFVGAVAGIAWEVIKIGAIIAWNYIYAAVIKPVIDSTVANFNFLAGVASFAWTVVKIGASIAWSGVVGVWNQAAGFFGGIFNSVGKAAGGIGSAIAGAFGNAFSAVKGIVVGAINWIVDRINDAIAAMNGLASAVPGAPKLGKVPHFAGGVKNFAGGVALVGERGPELVTLPKGSNVHTASETSEMLDKGAVTMNNTFNVYNQTDPVLIARELAWGLVA